MYLTETSQGSSYTIGCSDISYVGLTTGADSPACEGSGNNVSSGGKSFSNGGNSTIGLWSSDGSAADGMPDFFTSVSEWSLASC